MTTIRDKLKAVKAPQKKHAPLRVNSQAEADQVKYERGIVRDINTVNQRLMVLADHVDDMAREAVREVAQGVVAEAITEAARDAVQAAERRSCVVAQRNYEKDRRKEACRTDRNAMVDAADEDLRRANDAAYAEYVARHRKVGDGFYQFPSTLTEAQTAAYRNKIKGMSESDFYDLISSEHEDCRKANDAAYRAAVEAADIILAAQLAALDRGEEPPAPENIPGVFIATDDGTITCNGRTMSAKAFFAANRKSEFG